MSDNNCDCEFKKSVSLLQESIDGYTICSFTKWFEDNKNIQMLEDWFDGNKLKDNSVEDIFRDYFKPELFDNCDEGDYNYYFQKGNEDIKHIKANHFIQIWVDCTEWWNTQYDIQKNIESEEYDVNAIAYWLFEVVFEKKYEELFVKKVEKLKQLYLDELRLVKKPV